MGLLNKLFGYRWSLYVVANGKELRYAMHQHSVLRIVGYVMRYFAGGGRPVPPWSLHLNFNKAHQSFALTPEHFTPDGENVSEALIHAVAQIDPGWRVAGGEPVFEEVPSRRRIKIADPIADHGDADKIYKKLQARLGGEPQEETFFDVMDRVFGKAQ